MAQSLQSPLPLLSAQHHGSQFRSRCKAKCLQGPIGSSLHGVGSCLDASRSSWASPAARISGDPQIGGSRRVCLRTTELFVEGSLGWNAAVAPHRARRSSWQVSVLSHSTQPPHRQPFFLEYSLSSLAAAATRWQRCLRVKVGQLI